MTNEQEPAPTPEAEMMTDNQEPVPTPEEEMKQTFDTLENQICEVFNALNDALNGFEQRMTPLFKKCRRKCDIILEQLRDMNRP